MYSLHVKRLDAEVRESYDGQQSVNCSNPVYMNINTSNVAIEFIPYNSQLIVQHLYVFPWESIDTIFWCKPSQCLKKSSYKYNIFSFHQ